MKKIVLILSIFICIPLCGMKRSLCISDDRCTKRPRIEQETQEQKPQSLPIDMFFAIIETYSYKKDNLKETIKAIKSFALTNTIFCNYYTHSMNNITEKLYKQFFCSDESIAKNLCPIRYKNSLQKKLKALCLQADPINLRNQELNEFESILSKSIKTGANPDFTYNYKGEPSTLIMIAYNIRNEEFFSLLLEKESNFNKLTPQNKTLLMRAVQFPIKTSLVKKIIEHPSVTIDQQNNHGRTALSHCIKDRKKHRVTEAFISTIKNLLIKGADPELTDNKGKSPLTRAQKLSDSHPAMKNRAIQLIEAAIAKKNQPIQTA